MSAKVIRLRYAATCTECGLALPARTSAWWDAEERSTTCVACRASIDESDQAKDLDPATAVEPPDAPNPRETGEPGGSALLEFEKRHRRREEKIDQRWGPLAGVVKFLSDDPQATKAWAKGSEGERRLAAYLEQAVGDRAVLLHDVKIPRTRGNIDHIAIAASGIWVIDAKNYKGLVEHRDVGRWLKTDMRLYVGGRDETKRAGGLGWQIDAVRKVLDGAAVPISAALCFIGADWKLFAKPFQHDGIWVTRARKLAEMIAEPGPLTLADVTDVAGRIAIALPPQT